MWLFLFIRTRIFGPPLSAVMLQDLKDFIDGVVGIIKQGHRLLLLFFIINPLLNCCFTYYGRWGWGWLFGVGSLFLLIWWSSIIYNQIMSKRRDEERYDYLVKLVIIGDTAVGKTNILLRYVNEEYKMTHITTIGVDFKIKTINIDGIKIKMQIWDTAGQERFKTITETYYKGAAGVILVYSVTDKKSFQNLENWIRQINESQPESMCKIIVGNKVDCKQNERQVSFAEGSALAKKYGVEFVECSAKDNYNIGEIFTTIGKPIKEKLIEGEGGKTNNNLKIDSKNVASNKDKKNCEC